MQSGFDRISARAVQLRKNDLAAQAAALRAGDAAGKSAGGHEKAASAAKHHADALAKLHDELEQVSDDLVKQGPLLSDVSSAVVGTAANNAIKAFDAQLAEQEKHQQQLLSFADQFGAAIAAAATGTESLKQAFSDMAKSIISEIIQMSVRMLVFRALTAAFGGGSSSIDLSGGSGFDPGSINGVPGFASGGSGVFGGFGGVDQNVLSLNGSPIARVSKGEAFSVGNPANNNSRVIVELRDEMLDARIASGAQVQIVRTYPAMKADTIATIGDNRRRGRG